ncbi:MAG: hypothetical protein ACJA2W_001484 [Planctomycetota bacterium]|jgi:hypothetical protein
MDRAKARRLSVAGRVLNIVMGAVGGVVEAHDDIERP